METLFVKLYPLVAVLALCGYIPQVIKLLRAKSRHDGMAIQSWLTWILNSTISLGYGIFHLKDALFITTVSITLISMITVVGLLVYNRYFRFRERDLCLTTLRTHGL
jgi:uncharacterized protein with PQ loop repeat